MKMILEDIKTIKGLTNSCKILLSIYILSFFFFGMFYEFCGTLVSAILSIFLIIYAFREKCINVRINAGFAVSLILLAGYLISPLYAVDSGMAFTGIFKYLWVVLFLLAYRQMDKDERIVFIKVLPHMGFVMCILCFAGYFVPYLKEHLYSNGRLCGFFQYSNTFALFLLVGMIILCDSHKMRKRDYPVTMVLALGLGMTGSRMVMVLAIVTMLVLIIKNKNKVLAALIISAVLAATIYTIISGDLASVGRMTKLSLTESTFVGRLLYVRDALPLFISHPFGLGYKGYYYMENIIQTGVYYVVYIHNDLMQFGLDIGWIPMLVYLYAVIRALFSKGLDFGRKMLLSVIFVHGLFDFDLAYTCMLLLMLIIIDEAKLYPQVKEQEENSTSIGMMRRSSWHVPEWKIPGKAAFIPLIIVMLGCIYVSVPFIALYVNDVDTAISSYPFYTEAKLIKLSETSDADEALVLADEILEQNDTCALAWYAKAMTAYLADDYEAVILYQREAIEREPFNSESYDAYEYMLSEGVEYYESMVEAYGNTYHDDGKSDVSDDDNAADEERESDVNSNEDLKPEVKYEAGLKHVREELDAIPVYKKKAMDKVSRLGKMIDDQPEFYY